MTDANFETSSYNEYAEGYLITKNTMKWFWDNHVPDLAQRREVYASPLQAGIEQLKGLPSAHIQIAGNDVLRDEGVAFARKLDAAEVEVTLVRRSLPLQYLLLRAQWTTVRAAYSEEAQGTGKHDSSQPPVLLLLLRILQGVAVGGEVPGAWVFVSEHVNPSHVGLACGILTGGLTGGILLGSVVATSLSMVMTHAQLAAYGWRIPFLLGGAFGLLAMYVRRLLAETPVFLELKKRQALASETPLKAVVRDYPGAVVLSGLLTWMLSAAIVVVILLTPALLQKVYRVPADVALRANSLASLALTAGCVIAGRLTDRFGPGRVLIFGCPLLAVAAYLLYTAGTLDPWLTTFLYTLAGLTVGIVAVVPYIMIAMFPPTIRFSGISFSYNLAYAVFGGVTPLFVAWLLRLARLW
jgi:MFS family permease